MLNTAQQEAVDCKSNRILCLAGAGTGKTHTMIARISKLVEDGVDPTSILALTFTNVAAFEMKTRYKQSHEGDKVPEFRTFHSFCYFLIYKDPEIRKKLGYSNTPNIADAMAEKKVYKEARLQLGINMPDTKLFNDSYDLSEKEKKDKELILKAADRLMQKKNLITFDALCKHVCQLFVNDDPLIFKYKMQFKYVFADEYQDTDETQHSFVLSFEDSNIFVVGDVLQALYAFRGATSSIIKSLADDSDWKTIKLYENYRSTKQICAYANKHSKTYAPEGYRITFEATNPEDGPEVETAAYHPTFKGSVPTSTVKEIVASISNLSGSSAILVRTNAEVASIQSALTSLEVPYSSVRSNTDASNLIRSIYDEEYAMNWLASKLPPERYSDFIRRSTTQPNYNLHAFLTQFKWIPDITKLSEKMITLREICVKATSIESMYKELLKSLRCTRMHIEPDENKIKGKKLPEILKDFASEISKYESHAEELYVGTVHSVKGLEYDNVFVVGPQSKSWKLIDEDMNNLFYVAITRPRTNLTVYFAY